MTKKRLYPQNSIKIKKINYWESLHNKLQYVLNVHKEQGNKTAVFPFDLAYLITNKWNSLEKDSYKINCDISDFETEDSKNKLIETNLTKVKETRKQIHDRLQYLLDLHKNLKEPFPLDLVYMMDLDTEYFYESLNYDKEYDYDRKYTKPYYNSPIFYMTGVVNKTLLFNQLQFFDVEDMYLDTDKLKYYIKFDFITASVSDDYLLWKAADYDCNYNYIREYNLSYYNPDNYFLEDESEESLYNDEYCEISNDLEPNYYDFNHFVDLDSYNNNYTILA